MRRTRANRRSAFTLVELLMVVTIIGILVGILVPTVMFAMRSVKRSSIAIEATTLASAIEQYKTKYGDYPPDGSNSAIFERHYRKIFQQISDDEFKKLYRPASGIFAERLAKCSTDAPSGVMDAAEALVFALGGFSDDPIRPFTGPGGPFSLVPNTTNTYQYNVERNSPLYDFKQSQLTLDEGATMTISKDETDFGFPAAGVDVIPVYRPAYSLKMPYVYFDSRTYSYNDIPNKRIFFNHYSTSVGVARPYRSGKENTNVARTGANAEARFLYMNDRTFQIVSAGLDDNYGGLVFDPDASYSVPTTPPSSPTGRASPIAGPMFYAFPSGDSIDFGPVDPTTLPTLGAFTRYFDTDGSTSGQLDNVTNFSEGILADSLSN